MEIVLKQPFLVLKAIKQVVSTSKHDKYGFLYQILVQV
jgi:hypothetical protein